MQNKTNPDDVISVKGLVEKITYRNEQNGYTVADIKSGREKVTVVGILPFLGEGEMATFTGEYIIHPSYGRQFSVSSFERTVPEDSASILRYLSSGIIKGVGPATAKSIVDKFGADSLDIIQNYPEDLALIKGISLQKALAISEEYQKQYGVRDIMLLLAKYSVTPERCVRIYRALGKHAADMIRDNPYVLCGGDIEFPFESAECIASDFGISADNICRLSAGIEYILRKNLMNGHTCLPRKKLLDVAVRLLESDEGRIETVCDRMIESLAVTLVKKDDIDFIALSQYSAAEEFIASRLLAARNHTTPLTPIADLEIDYVENKLKIKFEKLQRDAIKSAVDDGVLLLTGGPGTGKTTTLNAIIELLERRDVKIELAAPTGRAAKRMTELTGKEAKTIHRLLEVEWGDGEKQHFCKNEKNPLDCDIIVLDESSMIDSLLFENLLRALRLSTRIIMVGDADQLPSVSAGNVFGDIIASGKFTSISLKKVFRQAEESLIITNAHAIINNTEPDLSNGGKDFFMIERKSAYDVCNTLLEVCTERLPRTYGFDPLTDVQIICPSRKLETGTVNLNNLLQQVLNPRVGNRQPQLSYKGVYMRVGDKVMQVKNNYDIMWQRDDGSSGEGIFNGDVGYISSIDLRNGIVNVRYDDKTATYFPENFGELELAYAVTVHKSQGSEFDCVVIPLFDIPSQLRYRNLLYTAVTRAKKMLVIVGSRSVFAEMAQNDRKTLRYTMLEGFINETAYRDN